MNKEEILSKSRQENKDEGMEFIENKGRRIGFSVFCVIFIFIILFNAFNGEQSYSVSALFWAFIAGESIQKYKFTRRKIYLITAVASGIATIASLVSFAFVSLR